MIHDEFSKLQTIDKLLRRVVTTLFFSLQIYIYRPDYAKVYDLE